MPLIIGIIDILVGVFFLFNIGVGVAALPFVLQYGLLLIQF